MRSQPSVPPCARPSTEGERAAGVTFCVICSDSTLYLFVQISGNSSPTVFASSCPEALGVNLPRHIQQHKTQFRRTSPLRATRKRCRLRLQVWGRPGPLIIREAWFRIDTINRGDGNVFVSLKKGMYGQGPGFSVRGKTCRF